MTPKTKPKFPRAEALEIATQILTGLRVERAVMAGSIRRLKPLVSDIEIVYIPVIETAADPGDFFASQKVNRSDESITAMIDAGVLALRLNANGSTIWGDRNKHAVHCQSGIPVDFFSTTPECWYNYLVCRTGSAENNIRIASAAKRRGWMWHPYQNGFGDEEGNRVIVHSEREVFALVGLPYLEPKDR